MFKRAKSRQRAIIFSLLASVVSVPAVGYLAVGSNPTVAIAEVLRDPASVLAARSPGARGEGAMTASKLKLAKGPTERVLSPVRERDAASGTSTGPGTGAPAERVLPMVRERPPIDVLNTPSTPGLTDTPADNILNSPGDTFVGPRSVLPPAPPSSSGGGSITPPTSTGVPEPATWMTMLLGFGVIGYSIRRRKAQRQFLRA